MATIIAIGYFVIGLFVLGKMVIASHFSRINGIDGDEFMARKRCAILWTIEALLWPLAICLALYLRASGITKYNEASDGKTDITIEL